EYYCRMFYKLYGLETISLRYFNVFGPRQDPQSDYAAVIPKFISAIILGNRPVIYGDGKQSRDFTFVQNVVEANIVACGAAGDAVGKVYNIAGADRYSLLDLLDNLKKISGIDVDPVFEKARLGDVKHSQADIDSAKKYLGFKISVGFGDGLEKTFEWYKNTSIQAIK
ncbi:MAG: NAD-dependent epimerase/dehydratase family protein, partial [bacterium]|nr:NAD-dependent epimerase/dehydratase family protein [bacterium]